MSGETFNIGHLKCDATALRIEQGQYLVLLNISFPLAVIENRPFFTQLLTRTAQYLCNTFCGQQLHQQRSIRKKLYYQINATYVLRHSETGDVRTFEGSFFPRGNSPLSLSGDTFIYFTQDTFVPSVLRYTQLDTVHEKLTLNDLDTKWVFDSIKSIIISCQIILPQHSGYIQLHQLATPQQNRIRRHVTYTIH